MNGEKILPGPDWESTQRVQTVLRVKWEEVFREYPERIVTLTVCDTCQGLIEGGCVAVVGQRDTHATWQQPAGECESIFILQEPALKLLIIHFLSLDRNRQKHYK